MGEERVRSFEMWGVIPSSAANSNRVREVVFGFGPISVPVREIDINLFNSKIGKKYSFIIHSCKWWKFEIKYFYSFRSVCILNLMGF